MNSRQRRKEEALKYNTRQEKLNQLLDDMEGHKDEWVIRAFGSSMSDEQLDRWCKLFSKTTLHSDK